MGAAADCEAIGSGLLGQPVNTISILAFIVAGAVVLGRRRLRWVGVALIATGVGSFLFHGPMPAAGEWAHDVTLAWLILVIAGLDTRWEAATRLPGLAVLGVVFALAPAAADPVAVGLAIVAIVSLLARDRSTRTIGPLSLLAVVAIIGRLGATGGPLCSPGSLLQPHAIWHLGAATAVAWWALGRPLSADRAPSVPTSA